MSGGRRWSRRSRSLSCERERPGYSRQDTAGCLQNAAPPAFDDPPHLQNAIEDFKSGNASYGTNPISGIPVNQTIYCVHGNPNSRCCGSISNNTNNQMTTSQGTLGHCHRTRDETVDPKARRKLIIASLLCVVFMILEVVGGYLSSSLAIATDAAHLLTDLVSFMISLFAIWVASRPPTRVMSFGWYRAEIIGALSSVLMIWLITGILVYMAIQRIITKEYEINATIMLITSFVGVVVNVIMGCTLHDFGHGSHGHSHGGGGHGHSHGGSSHSANDGHTRSQRSTPTKTPTSNGISNPILTIEDGETTPTTPIANEDTLDTTVSSEGVRRETNINVRAAFIHVIGDFVQSFGVLIAAAIIYFWPEWAIVDPICTFLFSIIVMATTFTIIRDALRVLMEGSPKGLDFQEVCNTFLSLPGVVRVHNVHLWALSLDKTALAAHIAISPGIAPQKILQDATRLAYEKYGFFELTLQIEEFDNDMEDCNQCQMPTT